MTTYADKVAKAGATQTALDFILASQITALADTGKE